uniref:Tail assembly chaperone n=1 Tax=Micrococcus phage Olihed TaxID=3092209 RepID=A0AAU6R639_9CAUD
MDERKRWRKIRRNDKPEWGRLVQTVPIYPDRLVIEERLNLGPLRISKFKIVKTGLGGSMD